jgi:hypothetical protein
MTDNLLDFSFAPGSRPHNPGHAADISFQQPHLFSQNQASQAVNETFCVGGDDQDFGQASQADDSNLHYEVGVYSKKGAPKTSLELELERAQAEKRALMKLKRKQDRLYAKIR